MNFCHDLIIQTLSKAKWNNEKNELLKESLLWRYHNCTLLVFVNFVITWYVSEFLSWFDSQQNFRHWVNRSEITRKILKFANFCHDLMNVQKNIYILSIKYLITYYWSDLTKNGQTMIKIIIRFCKYRLLDFMKNNSSGAGIVKWIELTKNMRSNQSAIA